MSDNFQVPPWNILLIDDDEDDFLLTRSLLQDTRGQDFRLVWAETKEAAMDALASETFDAALVDYQLQGENGLQLIRQAIQQGFRIPFILLTGHASYAVDVEALLAGATDFLVKDEINAPLLERAIRYAIEHKHTEETLLKIQNELETRVRQRTQALSLSNEELRAEIAERLRAEAALRATETQLRYQAMLLETANDAIVAMDENLFATGWNRSAELIYGWKAEEVIGQPLNDLLQTEIIGESFDTLVEKLQTAGQYSGQAIQSTKDGRRISIEIRATSLRDASGAPIGMVSIQRDITEKVQIEKELAELQRRLIDSLERERLEIAQELHDGPMQDLYALTYQLESFRTDLQDERQASQLSSISSQLQEINKVLRTIAGELRPPALAPFGLAKAIRSHADGFRQAYPSLEVYLDLDNDQSTLTERLRLTLFRIYQQSVVNVARHAHATRIEVRLKINGRVITLEVQDNGCGFEVPKRWINFARKGHMGLVGAAERAETAGGKLEVYSKPNQGTLIRVAVPITDDEAAQVSATAPLELQPPR